MEARTERVFHALRILTGEEPLLITEEERAIIKEWRGIRDFGYGRIEVVAVAHHLEGINPTQHKKRKDLINSPQTT
ncbi:hypothetical protein ES703_13479 [subsurface metagenome]